MNSHWPLTNDGEELSVPEICLEDVNKDVWRLVGIQSIASDLLVHCVLQDVPCGANEPAIKAGSLALHGTFGIDFPGTNTFTPHPVLVL